MNTSFVRQFLQSIYPHMFNSSGSLGIRKAYNFASLENSFIMVAFVIALALIVKLLAAVFKSKSRLPFVLGHAAVVAVLVISAVDASLINTIAGWITSLF